MLRGTIRFTNALGGTSDFIYPGPVIDMQSPASAGAINGVPYTYYAQSFDMSEWEIGEGAYNSGSATFARTTVVANSLGTTAKIDFTNPPQIVVLDTSVLGSGARERLNADRDYFVRADGSDSNTGRVNTSGGAFLTAQKAMDVISSQLDVAGFNIAVKCADGTYTGGVQLKSWIGAGVITFQGNAGTPSNVLFDVTGANVFDASFGLPPGIVRVKDLKTKTTGSGFHIVSRVAGRLQFSNIVFDVSPTAHVVVSGGGLIEPYGNYSIVGGSGNHFLTDVGGTINTTALDLPSAIGTVTLSGTPAFSSSFAKASGESRIIASGITFSGAATGARYLANENSLIRTAGGGANYFPGNSAGSTATDGLYT